MNALTSAGPQQKIGGQGALRVQPRIGAGMGIGEGGGGPWTKDRAKEGSMPYG